MRGLLPLTGVFGVLAACGGEGASADAGVPGSPAEPVCVWNHAYQENTTADSVEASLAGAQIWYILIDPFEEPAGPVRVGKDWSRGGSDRYGGGPPQIPTRPRSVSCLVPS